MVLLANFLSEQRIMTHDTIEKRTPSIGVCNVLRNFLDDSDFNDISHRYENVWAIFWI